MVGVGHGAPLVTFAEEIAQAFGVTTEEIKAMDSALGGPEIRSARQQGKTMVLDHAEKVMAQLAEEVEERTGLKITWQRLPER